MFKTLRNRLILSHILPLLVILPLMGIGLIYALETQIYLPALANELENDGQFLAQLTRTNPTIWQSPAEATEIVDLYSRRNNARMMMLDSDGLLLASNEPADQVYLGRVPDGVDLSEIRQSANPVIRRVHYSVREAAEVIDIVVAVRDRDARLLGFIRITYPFATFTQEIYQLRFLIVLLLAFGLLTGSLIGYILAVSIAKPVHEVTEAISALANNAEMKTVSSSGPEEVQKLSSSVNRLVVRLRELEQARRQLLANLVHELGRPLGALRSAITALDQGAEKDPVLYGDLVRGMDAETGQLQRLLNDLSGLQDHVLGALELERRSINLTAWLPDVLRTWQAAAQEKGIRWNAILPQVPLEVQSDPTRLAQVLGNLASNAIKFTAPGGTIDIEVTSEEARVGIAVQDSGPGINPEEQERIFEPFYQGAQGKRFPQGMGLGLSIARDYTQALGGYLAVESAPGRGSRFTVWLPVDQP